MKRGFIPADIREWIEARKRHRLSHAQVQMARELGMKPHSLRKLDDHQHKPWKLPLPEFIQERYFASFGREMPEKVVPLEERARQLVQKKAEKREQRLARKAAPKTGEPETP